jgi:hypothetical protein
VAQLIREFRYILQVGAEEIDMRVQELVWGSERWPERCRIHVTASHTRKAQRFYGATPRETVEQAVEYLLASNSNPAIPAEPPSGLRKPGN